MSVNVSKLRNETFKFKENNEYFYFSMKVAVTAIIAGIFCFLLVMIGANLDIDSIRAGGMILSVICLVIFAISFAAMLLIAAYNIIKKMH